MEHTETNMFYFDKLNFSGAASRRSLIVAAAEGFKPAYVSRMAKRLLALKQTARKRFKYIISQVLLGTYC